jgi:hypothetical protein
MIMVLRPDEQAAQDIIERSQKVNQNVKQGIKTIAGLGTATAGGAGIAKILPFLSQYIPADLAMKGISKVSPKLGEFLKRGQAQGLDIKEGLNFIAEKIGFGQKAKENRNIIEMESPELHQYLLQEVKKGRTPLQAGALAQNTKGFEKAIKKLIKDHKIPWSQLVETTYGGPEGYAMMQNTPQQAPQQNLVQPHPNSAKGKYLARQQAALANEAMNPSGSAPIQNPSAEAQAFGGQGLQNLTAILQKINQRTGG